MPPKMSCVTLPIGPIGVVSVSPVTRQATRARKNDSSTATSALPVGHVEASRGPARPGRPARPTARPGTRTWALRADRLRSRARGRRRGRTWLPGCRKARTHAPPLQGKGQQAGSDHARHAAPQRPLHDVAESAVRVIMPWCCRIGTNTAQHSVPPSSMLTQTRMPVRAPAARKIGSQ